MEEQKRRRERKSAAYWLSKSSILYPICILYVMYVKQVEVYITECSVHISSGTMLFASIRSPLSSAEILYFPEKCSPDSGRDYSPFFVRKVLPLRTETQASNISSYKSVPYSRILKQTEMRLSHFFLISRIFSENIFVFFYVNLLKP